jgi:hypothetical protein
MDEVSGRVALFGGVYNNHLALAALLGDAPSRASEIFCLGDVGAFGPHPDRSVEILREAGVPIGRPANDGQTRVWYAVLDLTGEAPDAAFIPLRYDHERLAEEMRAEGIAEPFVKTVETGWWTTCLEILPAKERAGGMY